MVLNKPRLIFSAEISRRPFIRRFLWWLLASVAAAGAAVALTYASDRHVTDSSLLVVGQVVAILVVVLGLLRALANLLVGLRRKNETLRFYDRGFVWIRGKDEYKYNWNQVVSFREGIHTITLFGRLIAQRGAHELKMRDGKVFRLTGVYGDMRMFAKAVRPIIADVTGERIARIIRDQNRSVRLNNKLGIWGGGIIAGKHKIPWSQLDVNVRKGKLVISRLNEAGKFKRVATFNAHEINNLGGFMDVAQNSMRHFQPKRFQIKVQGLYED